MKPIISHDEMQERIFVRPCDHSWWADIHGTAADAVNLAGPFTTQRAAEIVIEAVYTVEPELEGAL